MNMFGRLAKFMLAYQEELEIAFMVIVIAAAVFVVRRIVRASRKKRELLSQINDTVTQINTAVSTMNDKQNGVVYIDNRTGADVRPEAVEAAVSRALSDESCETPETIKECQPETDGTAEAAAVDTACADAENPAAGPQEEDAAEEAPETTEPEDAAGESGQADETEKEPPAPAVRKYFSRDCAVSKNGRSYTLEELNDQIRE